MINWKIQPDHYPKKGKSNIPWISLHFWTRKQDITPLIGDWDAFLWIYNWECRLSNASQLRFQVKFQHQRNCEDERGSGWWNSESQIWFEGIKIALLCGRGAKIHWALASPTFWLERLWLWIIGPQNKILDLAYFGGLPNCIGFLDFLEP